MHIRCHDSGMQDPSHWTACKGRFVSDVQQSQGACSSRRPVACLGRQACHQEAIASCCMHTQAGTPRAKGLAVPWAAQPCNWHKTCTGVSVIHAGYMQEQAHLLVRPQELVSIFSDEVPVRKMTGDVRQSGALCGPSAGQVQSRAGVQHLHARQAQGARATGGPQQPQQWFFSC